MKIAFLTPEYPHALLAVLADGEYQKFSSRTIGSWLYCSRFGIWTKGRQYFDDAGICIQQIKKCKT
jgi:hypothetical protein